MASRNKTISIQDIHDLTNNGESVFIKELGRIPRKSINSPLRKDLNPSFTVFRGNNAIYSFKDFSTGDSGSYIDFIMLKYNLTLGKALEYIKSDLELKPIIKSEYLPIKEKKETIIEFKDYPFQAKHRQYWDKYELDEDFLRENNVFAVEYWGINGHIRKVQENRAIFAYWAKDIDKVKILQVGKDVTKQDKWFNNTPNDYIWMKPTQKCDQLWINKSLKDALCMLKHFSKCVCATQNEDAKHLDKRMPELISLSNEIVINFGADDMGRDNSKVIQQKYNTKYWNTPKRLLKYGIQDISDLIAEFGVEVARQELKKKGFI